MNLEELSTLQEPPSSAHYTPLHAFHDRHRPVRWPKAQSLSSPPSDNDWVSPFTLPALPSLRRDRDHSDIYKSPEHLRHRDGSGAYYAAAWGSPYATPSPRRVPHSVDFGSQSRLNIDATASPSALARDWIADHGADNTESRDPRSLVRKSQSKATKATRKLRSERSNWLSDSEGSGSETATKEGDNTPTRVAYLDNWGTSPSGVTDRPPQRHQISESLATITPNSFHDSGSSAVTSERKRHPLVLPWNKIMAEQEDVSILGDESPFVNAPRRTSWVDIDEKAVESPISSIRPRPGSMQSYQRQRRKVPWNGKTCIIALPLTDRASAGLPPLLSSEQVGQRIQSWIAAGYPVEGFQLAGSRLGTPVESCGQSRPVYPDPTDMTAEFKLRDFQVHVPNQAEWESWVNYLKEEKLRALGVSSPSNSEAPPSTRSPFSPSLSRVSSGYPGLASSPPMAPSSSASNPLRATSNPFSPSLMSSAGISPQPGSGNSSQFNGPPKNMHSYKPSIAQPNTQGRMTSPYDSSLSPSSSFGAGVRPNLQPISSRQNSFSPNHSLALPNLGEVLSPMSQQRGVDARASNITTIPELARQQHIQSQSHSLLSQVPNAYPEQTSLPPRVDSLARTPEYNESARTPIEIAHPTPKSHRHNLSMALQREIDEAEAALHRKHDESQEDAPDKLEIASRKDSTVEEEPPILMRPETISTADEKSEIETNPSIAATPMLMDDKNPFGNWQALSDAAKAEPRSAREPASTIAKFNVEAKEFDPKARFSSANFIGEAGFAPFRQHQTASPPLTMKPPAKTRISSSHLNADAPAFTPSFMPGAAPKDTPFKFSAATFNVEAPVFNPSQSPETNFSVNVKTDGGSSNKMNTIFGNVVIDPGSRATRRTSKALPIVPPDSDVEEDLSDSTDDEGRPMAPIERQKRARRHDSDGDRSPVYADTAPFHHSRILSEIVDDVEANGLPPGSPPKDFDGWSYIPADESAIEARNEAPIAPEADADSDEPPSAFTFQNQTDAAMFNEARPPHDVQETLHSDENLNPETPRSVKELQTPVKQGAAADSTSRTPGSSLSALARPFEFNPRLSRSFGSPPASTPKKALGLEASKYATLSSPQTELTANISSPPTDLPHYVEEVRESDDDIEDTVEVIEEISDQEDIVEVIEERSTDDDTRRSRTDKTLDSQEASSPKDHVEEDVFDAPSRSLRPQEEAVPSFEEIDAVMKQFEVDPELGIERNDTPIQSAPLVDMRLGSNFRSDAPSPSPPRLHVSQAPETDTSHPPAFGLGIGVHKLNSAREDVSDWDLAPAEEAKLQLRSQFFDSRVNDLVDSVLENRLGPLERSLETIQQSLALMAPKPKQKNARRSVSTDLKDSDADDEDEYDAFEGFQSYRSRSPVARRGERKQDLIRAAVTEALSAYQPPAQPQLDLTEFNVALQEMKQLAQQSTSQGTQNELKAIMEDVISHHPRLRGNRVQQEHESAEQKFRPQIDGLESMLKISQEHAAEEARLRRLGDAEINELKLRVRIAEEEAAQYRESSEEAQSTLKAFVEEKESYRALEREIEALSLKNTALETTLEEYRMSSEQWREDIRSERDNSKDLKKTLLDLNRQLEDQMHSRQKLRTKLERVQSQMSQVIQDVHAEQADWRHQEHALQGKITLMQDALDRERRHREKAEVELDAMDKEHKESLRFKIGLEHAQSEVLKFRELADSLREENRALDSKVFNLDRQLAHTINTKDAELGTATARLKAELDSALTQLQAIKTDSEAQISRLQGRLDHAELDIEDQKAKHDSLFTETVEAHKEALREANERRETALGDQHQIHEKKLNDLRDRHTRELHNSFDNRTRLEHHLNEKMGLSDDKVKHMESKIADLEERLEITKSAARAAVEAATAKGINLPTPAPSVVASPPQRTASASLSLVKGSDIPEKISPQALRESIMVLQDQLQNREQRIEQLETELNAVDKDAPNKVKERDTEISWLRELLNVRIDDLEDIIQAVSKPDFDRDAVRDATIRLKANLQMEQQLKERAATAAGLSGAFPSISAISNYAQSPRGLPMAAAAAWGNWRKARDSSIGALSDLASNLGNQTPSRSTIGSPSSFLSGIITPPGTTQRALSGPGSVGPDGTPIARTPLISPPPSMRPLAAAAAARKVTGGGGVGREARPLRAYNSQPRALSGNKQADRKPEGSSFSGGQHGQYSSPPPQQPEPPQTPVQQSSGRPSLDLADDVDDDASLLGGQDSLHLEDEPEPIAG